MESLDNILSGRSEPVSEITTAETVPAENGEIQTQQGHPDHDDTQGQSAEESQVEREKRRGSGAQLDAAERAKAEAVEQAKAEARREADEEWRQRRLPSITAQAREAAIEEFKRQQQQNEDPDQKFWNGPTGYVEQMRESLRREMREENSLHRALDKHGDEAVLQARNALQQALNAGDQEAIAFYNGSVMSQDARDPYGQIIAWHQRRQTQAEIGPDPVAYKERLKAELREELKAELQGGQQQQRQAPQLADLPSNHIGTRNVGSRTNGPAYSGPTPLEDIFSRARSAG